MSQSRRYQCPRCRKTTDPRDRHFPFCSERCRFLDLGRWLEEEFRVAGEKVSLSDGADRDGEYEQ